MNLHGIGVAPLTGVELHWQTHAPTPRPVVNGETCDVCSLRLAAVDMFYDGKRFLCPGCRYRLNVALRR